MDSNQVSIKQILQSTKLVTMSKTKQPKPRKMWANYYERGTLLLYATKNIAIERAGSLANKVVPVAVVPLNDVEAPLQRAIRVYDETPGGVEPGMRAALTAIGVLPARRKGRK